MLTPELRNGIAAVAGVAVDQTVPIHRREELGTMDSVVEILLGLVARHRTSSFQQQPLDRVSISRTGITVTAAGIGLSRPHPRGIMAVDRVVVREVVRSPRSTSRRRR